MWAERVSIPFIAGQWSLRTLPGGACRCRRCVSIPFIAGQWSLPEIPGLIWESLHVSIPFIAGQWSLQVRGVAYAAYLDEFQSPSLRGSGRFWSSLARNRASDSSFNPLHCGAVVASRKLEKCRFDAEAFQSPSLRGSGRFAGSPPPDAAASGVSIPFIAGQWSLLPALAPERARRLEVSIPFIAGQWSLRPDLQAVRLALAWFQSPSLRGSGRFAERRANGRGHRRVSIPFIAGQWSLRLAFAMMSLSLIVFQSPSLRGSGRFPSHWVQLRPIIVTSFNPLHCGAVVASRCAAQRRPGDARFNPLHCGAVVASSGQPHAQEEDRQVSIPFIAGQWSLRFLEVRGVAYASCFNPLHCGAVVASTQTHHGFDSSRCFNPLHCGAVVASPAPRGDAGPPPDVSIPFIAGQWSLLPRTTPSSLFGVLLRKRRLPCDHIICTRLPF